VSEDLVEKLNKLMNEMKDWERKPLIKSGKIVAEIVKLPERRGKYRTRPQHLALVIKREDAFRGLIIVSPEELDDLRKVVSSEKLSDIVNALWRIYKEKSIHEFEL